MITIKNLNYHYPDGTKALDNISLEVKQGETVGIIGPNGAGKSTLLLHLNGILEGDGKVEVDGEVGLVFQNPDDQLFMPTVFDDVSFGPINMELNRKEIINQVDGALNKVGMVGFKERTSHHLSLGEKRKISLATVLSMNPDVLVLDEPTSNLDPASRREFINFIGKMDITKIIATHDLDMVKKTCSRVIILNNGKIILDGPTQGILSNHNLLQENGL